jgi:quercetin dioxygenase-like cupin family protein
MSKIMNIQNVSFTTTNWEKIKSVEYPGESGTSFWRMFESGNVRVRIVEYSPGFKSDHFCSRGHILLVLEGELYIKLKDGQIFLLVQGMSFQVEDDETNPHLAYTEKGGKVFIVD